MKAIISKINEEKPVSANEDVGNKRSNTTVGKRRKASHRAQRVYDYLQYNCSMIIVCFPQECHKGE